MFTKVKWVKYVYLFFQKAPGKTKVFRGKSEEGERMIGTLTLFVEARLWKLGTFIFVCAFVCDERYP